MNSCMFLRKSRSLTIMAKGMLVGYERGIVSLPRIVHSNRFHFLELSGIELLPEAAR